MDNLLAKSEKWVKKARKAKCKLEDEAYDITTELIKKFGKEDKDNFVVNLEERDNTLHVMEYNGFEGDYIGRDITSIELSKEYGGISLMYGEDEYDYIKYSDVLLSDRIYIINELTSIFE